MRGQIVDMIEANAKPMAYKAPQLVVFGNVVELTASGSGARTESSIGLPNIDVLCRLPSWLQPPECRTRRPG